MSETTAAEAVRRMKNIDWYAAHHGGDKNAIIFHIIKDGVRVADAYLAQRAAMTRLVEACKAADELWDLGRTYEMTVNGDIKVEAGKKAKDIKKAIRAALADAGREGA